MRGVNRKSVAWYGERVVGREGNMRRGQVRTDDLIELKSTAASQYEGRCMVLGESLAGGNGREGLAFAHDN